MVRWHRGGGGGAARLFFFFYFPVQQTTSGIGHRVKYIFCGLATNALNVRNNNNNKTSTLLTTSMYYVVFCFVMFGGPAWRLM